MNPRNRFIASIAFGFAAAVPIAAQPAKSPSSTPAPLLSETSAVGPRRFLAAHGQRGMVAGFATAGLEFWAYPFQILTGYRIAFLPVGATTPIPGSEILSRIQYEPHAVTRIYLGPDFLVRERIFVPLDQPGAIVTFAIEGATGLTVQVHATPVLDLMWPGGLGGQSTQWDSDLSAYLLSEPTNGYSAVVGSPTTLAHDDMGNRTTSSDKALEIGLTLQPDARGVAQFVVALNQPHEPAPAALYRSLITQSLALEAEATRHDREYQERVLQLTTPIEEVNEAFAWSELALDQAWVCSPNLGCGFVAGYGPSRATRRPQYDWFFAGDGLLAADASLFAGDTDRVRQELEFILRYQDKSNGMIWHELSQSAGLIDWAGKFPYMYVHVDVTFQFLAAVGNYVTASGDSTFIRAHWGAIQSAYRYCQSIIDSSSGLPRIPADKEGGNEQDRIIDDLGLSTSWVEASTAYAHLATLVGDAQAANEAMHAAERATHTIGTHYWSAKESFWISGYTPANQPAPEIRVGPVEVLSSAIFSHAQQESVLARLASSGFETSWGTRSVEAGSVGYDAHSYAKGSVWAIGTAAVAQAFWDAGRPLQARQTWASLLPWFDADSLGHMNEVMAGDRFRPQGESVSEQTWSSAAFLSATVHGLLGLSVDALADTLRFAPHLPTDWPTLSLRNIGVGATRTSLHLTRTRTALTLQLTHAGAPIHFTFAPQLPLGAANLRATLNGKPVEVLLDRTSQQTSAVMANAADDGESLLTVTWDGGIEILTPLSTPALGEADSSLHITSAILDGNRLTIDAETFSQDPQTIQLKTPWQLQHITGATAEMQQEGALLLHLDSAQPVANGVSPSLRSIRSVLDFNLAKNHPEP